LTQPIVEPTHPQTTYIHTYIHYTYTHPGWNSPTHAQKRLNNNSEPEQSSSGVSANAYPHSGDRDATNKLRPRQKICSDIMCTDTHDVHGVAEKERLTMQHGLIATKEGDVGGDEFMQHGLIATKEKEQQHSAGHDAYSAPNNAYNEDKKCVGQINNVHVTDPAHAFLNIDKSGQICNGGATDAHACIDVEKKEVLVEYKVKFIKGDADCGFLGDGLTHAEKEREAALKRFYALKIRQLQVTYVCGVAYMCVYVYVCVCVRLLMCVALHTCACMCMCVYVYVYVCVATCAHPCIHTYIHTYIHTCRQSCEQ
jgi:hypothetical protein